MERDTVRSTIEGIIEDHSHGSKATAERASNAAEEIMQYVEALIADGESWEEVEAGNGWNQNAAICNCGGTGEDADGELCPYHGDSE